MIKVIYSGNNFKKIEKEVLKAFDFVYKIFLIKIPNITVRVYTTREEFNKYIGEKTATWIIANASDNNEIAILSPSAMKRDGIHSSQEFLPVLKHEFTHLFIEKLTAGKTVPKWLNEGLAQYIAKQYKNAKYAVKTAEKDFCKKSATKSDWNKRTNQQVYQVAALFVYFLIKKYSFQKVKELLSSLDKNYYYQNFEKLFFKIYKISLSDAEKKFIEEINI